MDSAWKKGKGNIDTYVVDISQILSKEWNLWDWSSNLKFFFFPPHHLWPLPSLNISISSKSYLLFLPTFHANPRLCGRQCAFCAADNGRIWTVTHAWFALIQYSWRLFISHILCLKILSSHGVQLACPRVKNFLVMLTYLQEHRTHCKADDWLLGSTC